MKTSFVAFLSCAVLINLLEATSAQTPVTNMVWISPRTFVMGSPTNEAMRADTESQHSVTISRGFYIGRYEVTQGEYEAVVGNNPSYYVPANGYAENLRRPVESVRWSDATNYCDLLTGMELGNGHIQPGWSYRLPTEAEWEYACRAGTVTAFNFGNAIHGGDANFNDYTEYDAGIGDISIVSPTVPYLNRTEAVGSYLPNPWGLYDMHGNVWEWCSDWWNNGDYSSLTVIDPKGAASGDSRIMRGGGAKYEGRMCRSAERGAGPPDFFGEVVGFRIVLAAGDLDPKKQVTVSLQPSLDIPFAAAFALKIATIAGETYVIESKNSFDDPVWSLVYTIFGDGDLQTFLQDLKAVSKFYRLRKLPERFLAFPIRGLTAMTANISAVMDHSEPIGCPDQKVVAYTGETGKVDFGESTWSTGSESTNCPNAILRGFESSSKAAFSINGYYTGGSFLFYDGHSGYDFPYDHSHEVVAAADGVVYVIPKDQYNTIWIDHTNGYSTWYLHMLPVDTVGLTNGTTVRQNEHLGYCGNYSVTNGGVANHLHFTVKKGLCRVDPYGWAGPPGQDPSPVDGVPGHDNIVLWMDP